MNYRLVFDATGLEWGLALAAAAAFSLSWRGRAGLPRYLRGLRAAAYVILILAALKPSMERLESRASKPRLTILLDGGPGMGASDDLPGTRLARAAAWLKKNRRRISEHADPALFFGAEGVRPLSWEELDSLKPGSSVLDPVSVFPALAAAAPASARAWLISDGAFGDGEAARSGISRLGVPVDALGVGPVRAKRAAAISEARAPDFVFLHSRFPVEAAVSADDLAGSRLQVRLWQGDRKLGERRFAVERPFEIFTASFTVEAEGLGRQSYRLEAAATAPSGAPATAARELGVEVIRQKYRIMYLAGRPSFEYSHLRAQLKDDPNHELVSFVILRNPENVSPVSDGELSLIPFPAAEIFVQDLFQFDLFILENFAYWRFNLPPSYLQNLKNFVSRGGALLVIGGSNAFAKGGYRGTALEDALPVTLLPAGEDFSPGLFSPEVASAGHPLISLGESPEASAELWKSLPPLDGFSRFASIRPGATVLLRHPTEKTAAGEGLPIVAVREFGRGKVMMMGTDSTWRWKLGGGRNWKVSSFYARFWSRAVEYLTGSLELKKVKFSPLPERIPPREPAVLNLRVFDEHFRPASGSDVDLRIMWTAPDGRQRKVPAFEREPGLFQIELTDLAVGRHGVRAAARYHDQPWGSDAVEFRWEAPRGEAPLDRKALKSLADRSEGRYADLERADLDSWLGTLPPVQRERAVLSREPLWPWSGWFWALCALLIAEWALRRRKGYV